MLFPDAPALLYGQLLETATTEPKDRHINDRTTGIDAGTYAIQSRMASCPTLFGANHISDSAYDPVQD